MLLTMIMSLFSSILFGLAPCNSNCAALDQENTINVVDTKVHKDILDNNGMVFVISFNDWLQDIGNLSLTNYFTSTYGSLSEGRTYQVNFEDEEYSYRDLVYFEEIDQSTLSATPSRGKVIQINYVWTQTTKYDLYRTTFYYVDNEDTQRNLVLDRYSWFTEDYGDVVGFITYNIVTDTGTFNFSNMGIMYNRDSKLFDIFGEFNDSIPYQEGYNAGYRSGSLSGYRNGYTDGSNIATESAREEGRQIGDAEGYQRAISQGSTAATIFSGFVTVGLLPVNVLLTMFQYEVFGINIAGLVSGLFTIAVVIIIIRLVTGKKND